jgi:hypothetical protein
VNEWTLLGVFGVVLTAVVVGLVGGFTGIGFAIVFVVVWVFLPAVYSYAVGHVLTLGTTASALSVVELLFVEMGLLAVLFGPLTRPDFVNRGVVARSTLGFAFALFGLVVVGLALADQVWVTAVVLLLAGGVLMYGLHRYELVTLGLEIDDEDDSGDDAQIGREDTRERGEGSPAIMSDSDDASA